jgi:hypothetical protein
MKHRLLAFCASVFVAPAILLAGNAYRVRVTPLATLTYPPPPIAITDSGNIAFSERFAFIATDGGLFRAPLPWSAATPPQRIAFESTPINGIAHRAGVLYAIPDVDHPTGPGATTHVLLKSIDDGVTWAPIDERLEECFSGFCEFLPSSQIELPADRIFTNAGGNVLVSADEGASWNVLFGATSTGEPQAQACYDPAFAIIGQRLLLGGECPLDSAYLRTGTLRSDLLDWQEEPRDAQTPFLENRNIQFIRQRGASNVVFAGIEGALLRSDDAGASYDFVLRYEGDAAKYPYITHIVFPSNDASTIVIGGFDKANGGPYLAVSFDDGDTWSDRSHLLPGVGLETWSLSKLQEMPDGRIIAGAEDDAQGALHLFELRIDAGRRRAVRH